MTSGTVRLGTKEYFVVETSETVRSSTYRVTCLSLRPKSWRPAEVTIGEACVFVCLVCRLPPDRPCKHVVIVRKFVAGQPLEVEV